MPCALLRSAKSEAWNDHWMASYRTLKRPCGPGMIVIAVTWSGSSVGSPAGCPTRVRALGRAPLHGPATLVHRSPRGYIASMNLVCAWVIPVILTGA